MSNLIKQQVSNLSLLSLFMGGYLAFIPQYSQAQTALPQLQQQQNQVVDFYTNNPIYQTYTTPQVNQFGQNFEKYIVYVDSDNRGILQRIKQIESTAYIREVNGRRIIQSGVFTRPDNAQRRIRELESQGIIGAGILGSYNSGQLAYYTPPAVPDYNLTYESPSNNFTNINNNFSPNPSFVQNQSNYYYVVIPTSPNNLNFIGQEIQQKIGGSANVYTRNQPRGSHIAVGAFRERSDAEQWNDYLKSLGYGNARVYYGK